MADLKWNKNEALTRAAEDEALLWELMSMMVEGCRDGLTDLRQALAAGDGTAAAKAAHGIKGAAANLALEGLRELSHQAEQAGRAGDLVTIRDLVPPLEELYQKLLHLTAARGAS
jgi:HPt (histidine-containing phosphotransfer) domain-containing protein